MDSGHVRLASLVVLTPEHPKFYSSVSTVARRVPFSPYGLHSRRAQPDSTYKS